MAASDLSSRLRRRRALRVALGEHRFIVRPLDRPRGRPGHPRLLVEDRRFFGDSFNTYPKTIAQALERCHRWLDICRPSASSWWFEVIEKAFGEDRLPVWVRHFDVLIFSGSLFTGPASPDVVLGTTRRKAVCNG